MATDIQIDVTTYPLVSIALCTYNGAKYLEPQLDSLVEQTYPNIEIIVADDVSSDGTQEILTRYAQKYSCIKFIQNEKNLGYVKNFENVIGRCSGEFIALADQDDIWHSHKIALMVSQIGNAAMIYHDSELIDEQGAALNKKISDLYNMYSGDQPYPFFFWNCVSGHSILFRKALLQYLLPFHPEFYHDWLIAIVATVHGGIKFINEPLVKYRQHQRSTTDILNVRNETGIVYNSIFNAYSLGFLAYAAPRLKEHASYINALLSCFNEQQQVINRIKLFRLLISRFSLLLYRSKKSTWSKLNYMKRASLSKV